MQEDKAADEGGARWRATTGQPVTRPKRKRWRNPTLVIRRAGMAEEDCAEMEAALLSAGDRAPTSRPA